jgi:hypothetical protein
MPTLSQSRCRRGTERNPGLGDGIFPTPEKFKGLHETSLTHISIGRYNICSTLCWARRGCRNGWLFSTPPNLSGGLPRPSPDGRFLCLPSLNLRTQPFLCYPLSIDTTSLALDSSRVSPRIAPLLLAHIVDKLQVLPHHSDSILGVSVVNGLQLGSYASNSQG